MDSKALRGKNNEAQAAACLYIACRKEGVPRTFKGNCILDRQHELAATNGGEHMFLYKLSSAKRKEGSWVVLVRWKFSAAFVSNKTDSICLAYLEICAASRVSKKEIGRCFKLIIKSLETSLEQITSADFMVWIYIFI